MARTGRPPLVELAVIVVLPALLLTGLVMWASSSADAQPPTPDAEIPVDATTSAVAVLSLRRVPETLSHAWSVAALSTELDDVVTELDEASCLRVDAGDAVVRSVRGDRAVIPASNMKILTVGLLLDLRGPDWRYTTSVLGQRRGGGVIAGDLVLRGGGDPLLATAWYPDSYAATRYQQRPATSLEELAEAVVAAGVTEVRGDVVGDASRYDDERYRPTWDASLRVTSAGPYSALMVDDARIEGGGVAEIPELAAARTFRELLVERGVTVTGSASTGVASTDASTIASIESATLAEIADHTLQTSDNNSAELMLKEIAVASGRDGTSDDGLDVMVTRLAEMGVAVEGISPTDGSGLDIDASATCASMVAVLNGAGGGSPLVEALPLLGVEGTLAGVLADHPLAGELRAKTGSLGMGPDRIDVKALSGVLEDDAGPAVTFSLLLNGGTVREEATYLPIWRDLADALASYPAAPPADQLAP
jgi:serine-type D-Ala-D-Ala carboxypeptidase/endopeptidase (penicillin-binding protein 4)